jgi:predicted nucleic acid-binding protein
MADVLVDTSAWVDFFRKGSGPIAAAVDVLLDQDRVVLCGVVEMELLQGAGAKDAPRLTVLLSALRFADASREDFRAAGESLATLRRRGVIVPATDALIAALCLRNRLALLTTDSHFEHFPEIGRFASA